MKKQIQMIGCILICLLLCSACGTAEQTRSVAPGNSMQSFSNLEWPDTALASLLPQPISKIGTVVESTAQDLIVLVAETSSQDFAEYAEACWNSGFSYRYRRGDGYFYAVVSNGYHLSLFQESGDVMRIALEGPWEALENTASANALQALHTGEEDVKPERSIDAESAADYVLNTSTKKFHKPDCPSASDMKESNRLDFYGTREELLAQGYTPCKRCNP